MAQARAAGLVKNRLRFKESPFPYYKQFFQIGTLLKVNREDDLETDFELLLESEIGVVIVEEDKFEKARQIMAELKGEPG